MNLALLATAMGMAVNPDMQLQMLSGSAQAGAACLDGSDYGFYISEATEPASKNNWIIDLQGGGWCYDEGSCEERSKTTLGSSKKWANTTEMGGIFSSDCSISPDFCQFNHVFFPYCDGNSFSGNREGTVNTSSGVELHFRGIHILKYALEELSSKYNFNAAEKVLLIGTSAGGLATFLHTNFVGDYVTKNAPNLQPGYFRTAPVSGFFLLHDNVEGKAVYPTEMKQIFTLANSTGGVTSECIENTPPENHWQCNFAQNNYLHFRYPTFVLNSALDAWQLNCIWSSELPAGFPNSTAAGSCGSAPGYQKCSKNYNTCNNTQTMQLNDYLDDFNKILTTIPTYSKNGNGAFIHSCQTHVEAKSDSHWVTFAVNGVTMQQAVSKWWTGPITAPASTNVYSPCHLKTGDNVTRTCNPTCVAK
eukprot:TRINITY_DN3168_c1_g1_i1.p1 TRINITY_DN3168_c1_g1~~TRINITY_DN3168_c1_g1_i1.p1  ORF type:complete len:419 (+),score=77.28 TRINITY_DN3168_c1_g1_i1:53-1309(+)